MSSSSRRRALAVLALAPLAAACGFQPVYGPGGAGRRLRGQVQVAAPADRLAFVFVSRFEERLGRTATPRYAIAYSIDTSGRGLAITGADDITRNTLNGTLTYTVTDSARDETVHSGSVRSFTAYSTTGSPVATAAALRDAEDRLMIGLADRLISELLSSAGNWS